MATITVKNVWKEYAGQVVLERLNFTVKSGEFVAIVGASGCGKSTFLRMLLGQEAPSRGQILIDGAPLPNEPGADRGIVFQRYSVMPHLTVLGNALLGLELERAPLLGKLWGAAKRRAVDEATAMLHAVGLQTTLYKYPSELSGGMQQRLAIAQTLLKKPKILLLDEPFGALDPGIRADMHQLISGLWHAHQMTVFMITHDIHEGFTLGTRLMAFDKVRCDAQAPGAFGATVTYDILLHEKSVQLMKAVEQRSAQHERFVQTLATR